jgi:hypothetical protein
MLNVRVAECCIAPSEPRQAGESLCSGSKIQGGREAAWVGTEMAVGEVPRITVSLLWMDVGMMEILRGGESTVSGTLSDGAVGVRA